MCLSKWCNSICETHSITLKHSCQKTEPESHQASRAHFYLKELGRTEQLPGCKQENTKMWATPKTTAHFCNNWMAWKRGGKVARNERDFIWLRHNNQMKHKDLPWNLIQISKLPKGHKCRHMIRDWVSDHTRNTVNCVMQLRKLTDACIFRDVYQSMSERNDMSEMCLKMLWQKKKKKKRIKWWRKHFLVLCMFEIFMIRNWFVVRRHCFPAPPAMTNWSQNRPTTQKWHRAKSIQPPWGCDFPSQ